MEIRLPRVHGMGFRDCRACFNTIFLNILIGCWIGVNTLTERREEGKKMDGRKENGWVKMEEERVWLLGCGDGCGMFWNFNVCFNLLLYSL